MGSRGVNCDVICHNSHQRYRRHQLSVRDLKTGWEGLSWDPFIRGGEDEGGGGEIDRRRRKQKRPMKCFQVLRGRERERERWRGGRERERERERERLPLV